MYKIVKDKEIGLCRIINQYETYDKENEDIVLLKNISKSRVISLIADEFQTMIDSGLCDTNYQDFQDKITFIKTIVLDL